MDHYAQPLLQSEINSVQESSSIIGYENMINGNSPEVGTIINVSGISDAGYENMNAAYTFIGKSLNGFPYYQRDNEHDYIWFIGNTWYLSRELSEDVPINNESPVIDHWKYSANLNMLPKGNYLPMGGTLVSTATIAC